MMFFCRTKENVGCYTRQIRQPPEVSLSVGRSPFFTSLFLGSPKSGCLDGPFYKIRLTNSCFSFSNPVEFNDFSTLPITASKRLVVYTRISAIVCLEREEKKSRTVKVMTASNDDSASRLLSALIEEFESSLSSWKRNQKFTSSDVLLPTASQLYRLGLVLADLGGPASSSSHIYSQGEFSQVCGSLFDGIPSSHFQSALDDLNGAFFTTLELESTAVSDIQRAVHSMYGMYVCCNTGSQTPTVKWSLDQLQLLDSEYHKTDSDDDNTREQILALLSVFLERSKKDFEHSLPAIHHLQETSTWEDLIQFKEQTDPQWKQRMLDQLADPTNKEYLMSMFVMEHPASLNTAPKQPAHKKNNNNNKKTSTTPAATALDRLVQQVRSVFPHLGEGYVESALSHYRGDVEQTMSALVEGQSNPASLPVVLQRLDPHLPARKREGSQAAQQQSQKEEAEARRITQDRLRAMESQQEAEARALEVAMKTHHDEYNDDYDDQYDDLDGQIGADSGLYDDFDTIRTYNKMLKQVEEEQAFWQENRNENRAQRKGKANNTKKEKDGDGDNDDSDDNGSGEDGNTKKYRGPDKRKGGRLPKPEEVSADANQKGDTTSSTAGSGRGNQTGGGRGRGRGRGRGGGRGGGGGGRGPGGGDGNSNANTNSTNNGGGRGNARHKANKMASRRDRQKQSAAKKTGAG